MTTVPAPASPISFVIPVRNDAARLRRCLASIASNGAAGVEVIVVDNGSTDESREVAASAGARVLDAPGASVSRLRNLGAASASAELLAFVDADHTLSPDWVSHARRLMEDPRVTAAGSLCHAPADGTWVQRSYDALRRRAPARQEVQWLGAGNLVVRRTEFLAVGGFDTSLETCEDVDLCRKLRATGRAIVSDPGLWNVHHGDPATLAALFRGELWRGRDNLAVSLRPPVRLEDLPSVAVPVAQLAGLALAAAALLLGGAAARTVAPAGLLPLVAVPAARGFVMTRRSGSAAPALFCRNAAVAFVYDLARALALVSFAGHGVRRS